MELDVYRRQIKDKEINKFIENNKIKIQEEQRNKAFLRLNNDAKRRRDASSNLEKMEKILKKNDIFEEPIKKYSDEEWKKIYEERFDNYMQKVKNKKENMKKINIDNKINQEKYEINLCQVKKAPMKHIIKESNRMYTEAMRQKVRKNEKILRLKNNKYNIEDEYENDAKKYMKKIKEKEYTFINDENDNINIKSIDINKYIINNNNKHSKSNNNKNYIESKNIGKIMESSDYEITQKSKPKLQIINSRNNKKNFLINKTNTSNDNTKKIIFNFFEEERQRINNNDKDNKNKENFPQNQNDINIVDDLNNNKITLGKKKISKTASYIINQFFLGNRNKN